MKIIFMGTPDFAVPSLEKIYKAGYEIGFVITQPDAARDRGKKVKFPKVKEKALEMGLPVEQPEKIKNNEQIFKMIKDYNPDVIVVVAYGKILPKEILEMPKKACLNVHGSLLPKLRGAAPVQRAVLEGEEVTGITIMEMAEGLDTGQILSKREVEIGRSDSGELFERLSHVGGQLLIETLENIDEFLNNKIKQNEEEATYANMIFKEEAETNFNQRAQMVDSHIRGMSPSPGAFSKYGEEKIKFFSPHIIEEDKGTWSPGEIVRVNGEEGIVIATMDKLVGVKEIQFPGKKRMSVGQYIVGNKINMEIKF